MPSNHQNRPGRSRASRRLGTGSVAAFAALVVLAAPSEVLAQQQVDQRQRAERVQNARPGNQPGARPGARPATGPGSQQANQRADQRAGQFAGGRNPERGDPGAEFRRRNDIVTGNVAGGRGFRGDVGYGSAFDFRGDTGSDDLFEFRAGSLLSDPRLASFGADLRFGIALSELTIARSARATSANDLRQADVNSRRFQELQRQQAGLGIIERDFRRLVDASAQGQSLAAVLERAGADVTVGQAVTVDRDGQPFAGRLDASALGGLRVALADQDLNRYGVATSRIDLIAGGIDPSSNPYLISGRLSALDQARLIDDARAGRLSGAVGEVFRDSFIDTRTATGRIEREPNRDRVGWEPADTADELPAWQRIREEVARRHASDGRGGQSVDGLPTEGELRNLEEDLDRLRRGLGAPPTPVPPAPPGAGGDVDAPEGEDEEVDVRRLGNSLRHGQRIDELVDAEDRSRAGELISRGEQELREGLYFQAERTFTRALRLVPGHPTATVGLAHARIGAGLYIPAAITVRDLFTFQPEMIGATFGDGIVPNTPRLLQAVQTLRERVENDRADEDTGLVLAYIGRLLDRSDVIGEGLAVMRTADPDNPLIVLLEAIWLPLGGSNTPGG